MERQTKIIIGIIAGVVVVGTGVGIGIYYHNKKKKGGGGSSGNESNETKGGGVGTSGDAPTSEEITSNQKLKGNDTTIKIGSYGKKVAMYQAWLNWKYGANLNIDGKFGDAMMKAVRKYLDSTCGLSVAGVGDTQCRLDNNYKVNQLVKVDFAKPEFGKYMKADKGVQAVFKKYE